MDVILSAVFGFEANSQDNPDDPVISIARRSLTRSSSQIILLASVLPFGLKIIEKFPSVWLSKTMPLINMAENIVAAKRAGDGNSSRKVTYINLQENCYTNHFLVLKANKIINFSAFLLANQKLITRDVYTIC